MKFEEYRYSHTYMEAVLTAKIILSQDRVFVKGIFHHRQTE